MFKMIKDTIERIKTLEIMHYWKRPDKFYRHKCKFQKRQKWGTGHLGGAVG